MNGVRAGHRRALVLVVLFFCAVGVRAECAECIIEEPLYVDGFVDYDGGKIIIRGAGQIIIQPGAHLEIRNLKIEWHSPDDGIACAILQKGGELEIYNTDIDLHIKPVVKSSPHDNASLFFLRTKADGATGALIISGNRVVGHQKYGAGFVYASEGLNNFGRVNVSDNELDGLHGGVYIGQAKKIKIFRNSFRKVSYANIATSGVLGAEIVGNDVLLSGNGTSGDGMTIIGGRDIFIRDNNICFGSCYGIHVRPYGKQKMRNVQIEGNRIEGGITTGVYLDGVSAEQGIYDVVIADNLIVRNQAWGIYASHVRGLDVIRNVLSDNYTADNGNQHLLGTVNLGCWKDNLGVKPYVNGVRADPSLNPSFEYKNNPAGR